ncbi:hypothetical protein ACT3SQ_16430 [Brachybacterium sp. AOP42-C2-15]|uniref:hypothetical protein n=1 Tax=Brachybacterium sp. AOP42-C2-15 TaxID=3457670 RepID=UPI004033BA7D
MPERPRPQMPRRRILLAGAMTLALALILVIVLVGPFRDSWGPGSPEETPTATGPSDPARTTAGPNAPPQVFREEASLTVPENVLAAAGAFTLQQGEAVVVAVDVATEKPADSDGVNIFLGIRLTCTDPSGATVGTAGGTENLLTGVPVVLANQVLLRAAADGIFHCEVFLNAPNDEGASAGTTFTLDTSWAVTPVDGLAVQTPAVERLPMTIPAGERRMTFAEVVPLSELAEGSLQMHASLNLTTCTGVGGSREDGRTWCAQDDIDTSGSTYEVETRLDLVGDDGAVCGAIDASRQSLHLEHYRHHQLLHVDRHVEVPAEPCGDRVRVSVLLDNTGPASLVVHRENSSMITTETQVPRPGQA